MKKLLMFTVLSVAAVTLLPVAAVRAETNPAVVISEIQTRSADSQHVEFVELYNPTSKAVNLTDWDLQYLPASPTSWATKIIVNQPNWATHTIPAKGFFVLATQAYIDANPGATIHAQLASGSAQPGGHIRLLAPDQAEPVDLVGWGTATNPWGDAAPAPAPGESITRCLEVKSVMRNTGDNAADFVVNAAPAPGEPVLCDGVALKPSVSCADAVVSSSHPRHSRVQKIITVPDPANRPVDLTDCLLRTGHTHTPRTVPPDNARHPLSGQHPAARS